MLGHSLKGHLACAPAFIDRQLMCAWLLTQAGHACGKQGERDLAGQADNIVLFE